MNWSIASAVASFIMVVIGGAIIKLFIDRTFRNIDESLKAFSTELKEASINRDKLWEFYNNLKADIIRLQVSSSDTSKVSDLKAEFLEKYQTLKSAESDFDMLLSSINSLTSKFEKFEEKMLPYLMKREEDDK